jgi:cytochrome d ubiquinol oxidase subunit I
MSDEVLVDRLQFAFTVTFHYLFPILTMGLALFIAWLETVSFLGRADHRLFLLRKGPEERERYGAAARFWAKIFAVNFAVGVVTGIPMEFQFGTNWARFSNYAGGVIGQTLAMEGVFAFFAESVFLGIFLAGRGRVSARVHWIAALLVFAGSWLSGFFIIATDAWMQHPVAFSGSGDQVQLDSFWGLLTNPWILWQYTHNMGGAAITGAFVLAAMGAFFLLSGRHEAFARICVRVVAIGALIFCALQIFPTGDRSAHNVARYQRDAEHEREPGRGEAEDRVARRAPQRVVELVAQLEREPAAHKQPQHEDQDRAVITSTGTPGSASCRRRTISATAVAA